MPNFIKLAALIAVAALGAFLIRALFVAASHPGSHPPAMARVRAAVDDLPDGLLLRDSDLVWKAIPRSQVPPGALVEGQSDAGGDNDLKGDLLRHAVHAGTPLGPADVISPNAPGFLAAALKPGMRAISVAVDDVSGNAGLIEPGDYVDVLLTQQMRNEAGVTVPPAHRVESETVAERVRVLAVGSAFRRPKDDAAAPNTSARTVTFEVTPRSAQSITVAAHLGSLSLALRSFATRDRHASDVEDVAQPRSQPIWAGDVSHALRSVAPAAGPAGRTSTLAPQVIIYRGSNVVQGGEKSSAGASTGAAGMPPLPPGAPPA
ncbi:MAG TPA: Flp pilus assembly protein CpaB [Trinickia sp.]|jgi:pilus assembly protein CpaB|uniref:Flp pilus assembly protein CpaB n=1 Tax=Trinickia sp. TaxID=2571163 RepID=UPI002C0327DB|nr:Flp pilus assembly protein CpaB [Trinickia sp.]HTI18943.1 Flp pilus assembly protein CpaB [Trinickia sp.]